MHRGDKVGYERMWYHIRYGNGIEGKRLKSRTQTNGMRLRKKKILSRAAVTLSCRPCEEKLSSEKYPSCFYSSETGTNCIQCKSEEESALIFSQIPTENGKEEIHLFAMPSFGHSEKL